MNRRRLSTICFSLAAVASFHCVAKTVEIRSPDTNIKVSVSDDEGEVRYAVNFKGKTILLPSRLGLTFRERRDFEQQLQIDTVKTAAVDTTWQQPWGERKYVSDNHHEALISFIQQDGQKMPVKIRFRVFDDGLGFRYEGNYENNQSIAITSDMTEFSFAQPQQTQSWWIPSAGWNRYEYPYKQTALSEVDTVHTPFTMRLPEGEHVSIHEAALVDFAAMTLVKRRPGMLNSNLTPRSDGLKVLTNGNFKSSWRTIQISSKATGLLNSSLILNLNEPNKLGDVSWVEPGKYVGIWWGMHLWVNTWGSGPKHGATTQNTKEYMDFAAKYGFDGVLVEGWNVGWDGSWFHNGDVFSFTQSYPDFDLKSVTDYGLSKGVRLIGHHETSGSISNYEKQMDAAYALYEKHGVRQVKTGYVADGGNVKRIDDKGRVRHEWHDSQIVIDHYLKSVLQAAKHKISINTHEPVKDTGLRRTYPNWISREGARGQEFNAWGSPPNAPDHAVNLVYTRLLAGPMDFTPGIFNLAYQGLDAQNRVQTTLAKQLALYVVLYSPIQMAADLKEHYEQHMDAFQFILDVPTDWQESRAIAGEVGEYVVFARQQRDSDDWFLGAITDENARQVAVSLDFLQPNKRYQAQIYQDGKQADWKTRPYDIDIHHRTLTAEDSVILNMATSGGTAIRFKAL